NLSDCTVGIIGTGNIGQAVIKRLWGFGCKILAYDPYEKEEVKKIAQYVDFDTLIKNSDIISLHSPGSDENHHLINKSVFDKMKEGAIIINTARGRLIDTDSLIDALESKKIGGAALDVLEYEDGLYYADRMGDVIVNRRMAVLRSFPNVILTPHTAFYSERVVSDMAEKTIKCVLDMEKGNENQDVVVPYKGQRI
ncbi:MAG: NAD(P)-dependent oxidoreductase, partial [Clostridia bacterium]|nr:NAD(P)-dependent oxidoreductase [Clostridia bacterium]